MTGKKFDLATIRSDRTMWVVAALAVVLVVALAIWGLRGIGDPATASGATAKPTASGAPPGTAAPSPTETAPADAVDAPATTTVAAATGSRVEVHGHPGTGVATTLTNPRLSGAPLVFRVVAQEDGWVQVMLAQRPNRSTGWVPASAVTLSTDPYALVVTVATNTLDLYKGGALVKRYPVATGTGDTPTPIGRFALTELLVPTNEGYGPYAYGTTAFSDVLNSFGGGPGQIGLHGTDDAAGIGTAASHGCIRMHNADITELAKILPLGTPLQVR